MIQSEISDKYKVYISDIARLPQSEKKPTLLKYDSDEAELILEKV